MKKILITVLLLALLAGMNGAFADNAQWMQVYNCEEWVSLREKADTGSDRIAKVWRDEWVYAEPAGDGFYYCVYDEYRGYILSKYLRTVDELDQPGEIVYSDGRVEVYARHFLTVDSEACAVSGKLNGKSLWSYETETDYVTELELAKVFLGGTAEKPAIMVYNSCRGLLSLDPWTGETNWFLSSEEISLGGSISCAVDSNGTMYIAGFYGPDPVAISAEGEVLWTSDLEAWGLYWPYEIWVLDNNNGLIVTYDGPEETVVFLNMDGTVKSVK